MGRMCRKTWDSPSIGPRISTCWWSDGRSGGSWTGDAQCEKMVVGGVPTLQGEDWLACDWVHEVNDHHLLHVVLLDDVERLTVM